MTQNTINYPQVDSALDSVMKAAPVKGVHIKTGDRSRFVYDFACYVGLDVHKDSIAISVAYPGREEPEYWGEINNTKKAVDKLLRRLSPSGEVIGVVYEAGPCGYGLYRQILASGHDCQVVAPSLIPKKPGEKIKTDRRDALKLAREHRAGSLTSVWVPDEAHEAVRDLTRAREDMKIMELKSRQQLSGFLLRHGRVYPRNTRWGPAHFNWLEELKFDHPEQQVVLQEYIDAVKRATRRVADLELHMMQAPILHPLARWLQYPG